MSDMAVTVLHISMSYRTYNFTLWCSGAQQAAEPTVKQMRNLADAVVLAEALSCPSLLVVKLYSRLLPVFSTTVHLAVFTSGTLT